MRVTQLLFLVQSQPCNTSARVLVLSLLVVAVNGRLGAAARYAAAVKARRWGGRLSRYIYLPSRKCAPQLEEEHRTPKRCREERQKGKRVSSPSQPAGTQDGAGNQSHTAVAQRYPPLKPPPAAGWQELSSTEGQDERRGGRGNDGVPVAARATGVGVGGGGRWHHTAARRRRVVG